VKDEAKAARYYKLTVDQNDTDAQYDYPVCLDDGRGVVKNEAEAAGYFEFVPYREDRARSRCSGTLQ
jgi:TPR repeat protein